MEKKSLILPEFISIKKTPCFAQYGAGKSAFVADEPAQRIAFFTKSGGQRMENIVIFLLNQLIILFDIKTNNIY